MFLHLNAKSSYNKITLVTVHCIIMPYRGLPQYLTARLYYPYAFSLQTQNNLQISAK